jgi:hypothetical protein
MTFQKKPNLFIVGAPKAGTTSLHKYLEGHKDILMSSIKEPNYFSSDELVKFPLYYDDAPLIKKEDEYLNLFNSKNDETILGEASVSYLFYPEVAKKIKDYNKDAKIIIVLRNPIERAFSHYLMDFTSGYFKSSFSEAINRKNSKNANAIYQQVVELGLYYNQVKIYIDTFGYENVLILFQEEMRKNVKDTLRKIFSFLNINDEVQDNQNINKQFHAYKEPKGKILKLLYHNRVLKSFLRNILTVERKNFLKSLIVKETRKPVMKDEDRVLLVEIYRDDVNKLEVLLKKDIYNIWKDFK